MLGSISACGGGNRNKNPEKCGGSHDAAISCIQQIDTTTLNEDMFKEALQQCLSKTRDRNENGRRGGRGQGIEHENEGGRTHDRRRIEAEGEDSQRNNNCSNKSLKEEQVECFINLFQNRKQERCKTQ